MRDAGVKGKKEDKKMIHHLFSSHRLIVNAFILWADEEN